MECQKVPFLGFAGERVDPGIVPDIAPVPPKAAELDVVAVGTAAGLEDEDQLMLASVQRAHPAIVFDPDAEVLEFGVRLTACGEQFPHVPPIHADIE